MKKVMIIAVTCMISVTAFGQVKFGIKAGGNMSHLSGQTTDKGFKASSWSNVAYGFHAGGYVNYSFNDVWGAQAEAVFSMQGGERYIFNTDTGGTLRLNYVNIPLLLEIKPFTFPLSFLVGPQFGFCVSRSFVEGYSFDKYKTFDFAAAFGLQYTFIEHLTVGARCNIGLIPSVKYDFTINNEKATIQGDRNSVLQLSAGWTF